MEKEADASILNLVPSGLHVEKSEDAVEIMENEIDIKPDATELLRACLSASVYSINAQSNLDHVSNEFPFRIKQEQLVSSHGPAFGIEIKSTKQRADTCAIITEEPELHNAPSSEEMGDGIKNISYPGCVHSEDISMSQTTHPHVMMKNSDLSESDARQWHGFKVNTVTAKPTFKQRHSHIDPFISLCKIPNTIVKLDGPLRLPITSDVILSPLCWFGVRETCPLLRQSNEFNCSESISISTMKMQPIKDACRFLNEDKTCPAYGMSVVDKLIFGCPELENDVADTRTSTSPCHPNSLTTCFPSLAMESNELNGKQNTAQICTGMEKNDVQFDYNEKPDIKRHTRIIKSVRPFEHPEFGQCFRYKSFMNIRLISHTGKTSLKCPECGKCFGYKSHLTRHMRKHTGEKPYKCPNCGKCFSQRSDMNVHMRLHTRENPFKFLECGKCFGHKSHVDIDMRIHTGENPHKCPVCGKCFRHKSNVNVHMRSHTGEKPYKCPNCVKSFSQRSDMNVHMRLHTGEKPFKCPECDKCFSRKSHMDIHMRSHTGEKHFECPDCGKCFRQKSNLNIHIRSHTGEKPYKCPNCVKSFSQRSDMNVHMRIHTGEKPFKCPECDKCFIRKSFMDIHMRSHTGEKPFECPDCGKCFSKKSYLDIHIRSHSGEKPYKCTECSKCFSQKSYMTNHMRTHTGEKPFKCPVCDKYFSQKSSVSIHMRIHTGEKPFKCAECGKCLSKKSYMDIHMRSHSVAKPFKCPD